jgi:outer membrane protein assembly factor BamD
MKQILVFFFLSIISLSACQSSFEKVQKSTDFSYKLTKADEYFDKKQFSKANQLYEELLTVYKGTKNFENLYYRYAYTFYNNKDYLAASYHFKNFADLFPNSPKTEECEYLNSLCLFNVSPEYTLDQSNTIKAIGEMQTFVNTHPQSKHVKEANKRIDEARAKLEEKDLYAAQLYYKIGEYRSAGVAFEQIIRKYPDSGKIDYYAYMMIRSNYTYAQNSIPEKQEARFAKVNSDYEEFMRKFPKSSYRSEVEQINSLSLASLKKIAEK